MKYNKVDYYDDFACVAGACPDTCCAGWQIVIDDDSFDKYEKIIGDFGQRMKASLDYEEQSFRQCQGRCIFLNQENLCDLIITKGEDYLCKTCAGYPRHTEEFEDVREYSLSISCPIVARQLFSRWEPVGFLQWEDETEDPLAEEFEDFDCALFSILEESRELLLSLLQNRELPIRHRMILLLYVAGRLQYLLDEGREFESYDFLNTFKEYYEKNPAKCAEQASRILENHHLVRILTATDAVSRGEAGVLNASYESARREMNQVMKELERLRSEWERVLSANESGKRLSVEAEDFYREFEAVMQNPQIPALNRELFQEQIAVFFVFTYFCGAVYDNMIYSKAALAVFSACFLEESLRNRWILADKKIEKADCINLTYAYAREVEHSDENLIFLEEWLMERYLVVEEEIGF